MVKDNKTGCCFITIDAYSARLEFNLKNAFRFMGKKQKSRFEKWLKGNPNYITKDFTQNILFFTFGFSKTPIFT